MNPHLQAPGSTGRCLNCGATVSGKFCAACGQATVLHVAVVAGTIFAATVLV